MPTDEKKVIEIVVKTTGAADIKKLASELAAMRREAQGTRKEIQQTNQTLVGFGKTFSTVGKAFAGGLALKSLVQSSELVQELTTNIRDLAGTFIDTTFEAAGFTELLDDEFWLTATQGAKDLANALGDVVKTINSVSDDSKLMKLWALLPTGGLTGTLIQGFWKQYSDNAKIDASSVLDLDALYQSAIAAGEVAGEGAAALKAAFDAATQRQIGSAESAARVREAIEQAEADRKWFQSYLKQERPDSGDQWLGVPDLEERMKDLGMEKLNFDLDELAQNMIELTEESDNFVEAWDTLLSTSYSWNEGLEHTIQYMKELNELMGSINKQTEAWGETLTYAFKGVLTRELHNTRDLLRSILHDMRSFYAELAARAAAAEMLGWVQKGIGLVGAAVSSGASGSGVASWNMIAKGGLFEQGRLIPMANGGIVSRPTVFPMASGMGLMGEAGPEAVMPLKRGSDGKLGVAAGRSNVVIENHGQPVTANVISSEEETRIVLRAATMGAEIAQAQVNRSVTSGYGATAQSFQRAYGLRRRV